MIRRSFLAALSLPLVAACTPAIQSAAAPQVGFTGPRLEDEAFVSFDGQRLALSRWMTADEPEVVIVGLHGFNDYANTFHLAAPWWAERGIATYAFDQRGFGRSPGRGVWAPAEVMTDDVRTLVALVRARHPKAILSVVGVSMGGSVAIAAFASDNPPAADNVVLLAPGVWGWSAQPLPYKTSLWLTAHLIGDKVLRPPEWVLRNVRASDNIEELIRMGRDPQMIWGARSDTMYGLVGLMDTAWRSTGEIAAPVGYFYGARDQIVPPRPSEQAASRLKPTDRTAYYPLGYHLLLIDKQRERVLADVAAFIRDPAAPLPSAPGPIRGLPRHPYKP
jgi:alpha-beta hydrolase superfamily lysophospholipase